PVELLEAIIARAEATEPGVNALCLRYFDEAREQARAAEKAWGKGTARALEGIPVAIKDEALIAGKITTNGSLLLKDYRATQSDVTVQRLQDAGAVFHARTATPEFSMAFTTHSRLWGTTRNPWNLEVTPGGSSGGAGASLAAGSTTLAGGSDIGGSIRVPAALTGTVGFKPPYGRVPQSPPYNLDCYSQEGPMARTVEDCRLMQNVIAGPHPRDPAAMAPKLEIPAALPDIRGWRIGYSRDLGFQPLDDDVPATMAGALDLFREAGARVEEVNLRWSGRHCMKTAMIHYSSILAAQLRRDFGSAEQREQLTPYIRHFLDISGEVSTANLLAEADHTNRMAADLAAVFESCQLLVVPTVASTRVAAGFDYSRDTVHIRGKAVDPILGWVLTYPFNILNRCPVLNLPAGLADNGVPAGVQIIGRPYDDVSVFAAGAAAERAAGGAFLQRHRPAVSG
ncbi:MAG: amidase, partial [Gammaproteobacteria bacterium]|nr:amidase [Gammaproteobacteria bacterium]